MQVHPGLLGAGMRALSLLAALLVIGGAALAQPVVQGSDHPMVGKFEGSKLIGYSQRAFESRSFVVKGTPDRSLLPTDLTIVEGKSTLLGYTGPVTTSLEIFRNYQESLKSRGFTEAYRCENNSGQPKACPNSKDIAYKVVPLGVSVVEGTGQCFKNSRYGLFRKGDEVTVAVLVSDCFDENKPPLTLISVTEKAAMKTGQIVVPTPAAITSAFAAEGKIALYGIFFDTGKAEVKPESRPTLQAIAQLMGSKPALALVVTGYTDNVGAFEANVALSKRRAESVVAALVSDYKISASRLTAFGAGMTGPRGPNTDDAGRAKNRRVELSPR